jgi:hypothetical protein
MSSNPAHGEVYSIQHNMIKFESDLWQVGGFLRVFQFPPSIKLTPRYNWNIVEGGVRHHNPNLNPIAILYLYHLMSEFVLGYRQWLVYVLKKEKKNDELCIAEKPIILNYIWIVLKRNMKKEMKRKTTFLIIFLFSWRFAHNYVILEFLSKLYDFLYCTVWRCARYNAMW